MFQLLEITGTDAQTFLQGQLTQDIRRLDDQPALLAALCNPKGRVISVTRLIRTERGLGLVLPNSLAKAVAARLAMYRFRANVELVLQDMNWRVLAVAAESDLETLEQLRLLPGNERNAAREDHGLITVNPGASPRYIEIYGSTSAFKQGGLDRLQALSDEEWMATAVRAGLPIIEAGTTEQYTPHMLNLDCLDAISFSKGCYTGQEVVARTEHRGRSNRRLSRFNVESPALPAGAKLQQEGRDVGEVVMGASTQVLAVVPVALHQETLECDGRPAVPAGLPYNLPMQG